MLKIVHKEGCPDGREMYRASGTCICLICGEEYFEHPYCAQAVNSGCYGFNSYFIHVLCNGDHVKL